jgi:RNA:NAD 2'-phosphotransferase (TPT1/KptA family)
MAKIKVYHGTSAKNAKEILKNGFDMEELIKEI